MAGRECHLVDVARIPGRNQMPSGVRVVFQAVNQLADLVDQATIRGFPAPPLLAIHRPEITIFIGPFIPDADAVFFQVGNVGVALQKPEQFMHDRLQVQLLGGHHREAIGQIKTGLPAENRASSCAGAVRFVVPRIKDVAHQVEILLHEDRLAKGQRVILPLPRNRSTRSRLFCPYVESITLQTLCSVLHLNNMCIRIVRVKSLC